MDIKNFNEALYASSNGVIVERRKSLVMPLIVLLVGIGLLVANYFIENGDDANNLMTKDSNGSGMIWNTPYSQFVRGEVTLGRTWVFGR